MPQLSSIVQRRSSLARTLELAALLLALTASVSAQSTDPTFPTPVGGKEIAGAIPARDIGDARLTDQYFGFIGEQGDFYITVQTKNLNGDFDIFTAGDLRPLLKITAYTENTTPVTKNVFLHRRENLILRVEGRSPNDDDAVYEIRFSGSFVPIRGGVLLGESDRTVPDKTDKSGEKASNRRGGRVNSAGARIEEPQPEVAVAPTPEPTPVATPNPTPEETKASKSVRTATSRSSGGRRTAPRKPPTKPAATTGTAMDAGETAVKPAEEKKPAEEMPAKDLSKTEPAEASATTGKAAAGEHKATEASKAKDEARAEKPKASRPAGARGSSGRTKTTSAAESENKAQLLIEMKDGTKRLFLMNTVQKVTVENGQIVVITNDGYTERISMTQVSRMTIGP